MEPSSISIVITAYNNKGLLRQLLKGLRKFPPRRSFNVHVVDNHSSDGTKEMVREFPEFQYHYLEQNFGLAYANNFGVRQSDTKYILILNPDIAIFGGQIDALVDFADQHPNAGITAPKLLNPDGSLQYSTFRFPKWYTPILRRTPFGGIPKYEKYLRHYIMKDWDHEDDKKVDWVLGAAMLVRRSALEKVGAQDENFFLYFEDVDWCKRFWQEGFEVWYAHAIKFVHYHKRESAEHPGLKGIFNPVTKMHVRSWIQYFKKHKTAYGQ